MIYAICHYSPEEFEQRIDSELAALDSLPLENNRLHRCSVISEDLLEFSDNLIECSSPEPTDTAPDTNCGKNSSSGSPISSSFPHRKISVESRTSTRIVGSEASDASTNSTPTSFHRSDESTVASRLDSSNSIVSARSQTSMSRGNFVSTIIHNRPSNFIAQTELSNNDNHNPNGVRSQTESCNANITKIVNSNENFENSTSSPSSSGNNLSNDRATRTSDLSRQSDHVSCEDLLEFACDGPNVRRTRGPRNGEQSDEVRIMLKVLHEQSTPESCVAALNVTDWDVLAAIKLERLQGLLKKENNFVGLEDCKVMLSQCGGDVVKAAALLRNTEDTAAV